MNYFCGDITDIKLKEIRKWEARLSLFSLGIIPVTFFRGNELGGDIARSVYCFGGIKPEWVKEVQFRKIDFPIIKTGVGNSGNVLIVGQNLKRYKLMDDVLFEKIQRAIESLVKVFPLSTIHYVKHPRAIDDEFFVNGSESPQGDYLCVEELISSGKYRHVISCCSSALINSKLIAGDAIDSWAVGVESYPFPTDSQRQQFLNVYKAVGVNVVPV